MRIAEAVLPYFRGCNFEPNSLLLYSPTVNRGATAIVCLYSRHLSEAREF